MEKSHGQLEMVISPLSFALALMFPTQSGFSVLTLIHAAEFTSAHTHFLPSSAEETQTIHLHINSNPPFHHLGCKKISCSSDWLILCFISVSVESLLSLIVFLESQQSDALK